jgi:acyl-CoA reductase-like NAD-dependent aldehyde dehydrogenase
MAEFTVTIGGWSIMTDAYFDVINPATGGLAERCPSGGEAEVDAAVAAAKARPHADASSMGLGGSVWSSDVQPARDIALQLESGTAWGG